MTAHDIRRGDVWWHEPPEEKARPVVVVTRDTVIPHLHRLLVAPTTTTIRGIPTEVKLDESDGMPRECVVSLDNVGAVRSAQLTRRITTLGSDRMALVCQALRIATDC